MSGNTNNSPMLKAAGLWAKTASRAAVPDRAARRPEGADPGEPGSPVR